MITTTPLEDWLASRRISIREARAICAKKHCASAFDTLICHPYTLPKLALAVARALRIPAEAAAPMGRPLDGKAWKGVAGLAPLDRINADPNWHRYLRSGESADDPPCWLDVVNLRQLLGDRGINWVQWQEDNSHIFSRCRNFSLAPDTRLKHIGALAELLGVPVESLLTNIPTIAAQQLDHHVDHVLPVTDAVPADARMTNYCQIDCDAIVRIAAENGISWAEAGRRRSTGRPRTEAGFRNAFRNDLNSAQRSEISCWATARRFAAAVGCEPEDIAHRLTALEYRQLLEERKKRQLAQKAT
jgi:hypothetical protein